MASSYNLITKLLRCSTNTKLNNYYYKRTLEWRSIAKVDLLPRDPTLAMNKLRRNSFKLLFNMEIIGLIRCFDAWLVK